MSGREFGHRNLIVGKKAIKSVGDINGNIRARDS